MAWPRRTLPHAVRFPGRSVYPKRRGFGAVLAAWRSWALLTVLLALWPTLDGALVRPPALLTGAPEAVSPPFTLCDSQWSAHCVVDGDTLHVDGRRIRLIGIDAPETHPARCPEEARMGAAATLALQRQLNLGPFTMTGRLDDPRDKYGRELRMLTRKDPDGAEVSIEDQLLAAGVVRRYLGGLREGWCP